MRSVTRFRPILLAAAVSSAVCGVAAAEQVNFGSHVPTVEEFVTALSPAVRMRGIKPVAAVEETPTVSMELRFTFDSAELTEDSKRSLDNLSVALKTEELTGFRFRVEGHTDASGSEYYNQSLSERRAASVRAYLVQQHRIDPQRLETIGKGESELLVSDEPTSGLNRRVAIINMGM